MNPGVGDGDGPTSDGEDDSSPTLSDLAEKVQARRSGGGEARSKSPHHSDETLRTDRFDAEADRSNRPDEGFGPDARTEAIIEVIGDASNLLLLGPLLSSTDYDLCTRLTEVLPEDPAHLLVVTLTESPDERLNVLRGYLDPLPRQTAVLSVGDSTRSGSKETISTGDGGRITIENISDPTDLMRIGIAMSKQLSEWADDPGDTVVCFHSLTALLQFAEDPRLVFRFMHVLRGRVQSAGAYAHYHLDSGAHDDQTVATFRPLFDEVLTFDEEGSVHVARS